MENIWAIIVMLEKWNPCCILLKPIRTISVLITRNIDGVRRIIRAVHILRAKAAAKRRGLGVSIGVGEELGVAVVVIAVVVKAAADIAAGDVIVVAKIRDILNI